MVFFIGCKLILRYKKINRMEVVKLYEKLEDNDLGSTFNIKDFLFFFDISINDLPKLIEFSESIKKDKQFVFKNKRKFQKLTGREKQIFALVVKGKTTNEIAEKLFIENVTVSTHRKSIKRKLELQSMYDWYRFAKAFDILKL